MDNFILLLYKWYNKNCRDLPWRHTNDPYKIWVSEIILQQTRVDQGISYYERFIEKFPDIEHLAAAQEDEVLKQWQGLGYYTRARNMHATAKHIRSNLQGKFPRHYAEILDMKGIGPYTAAIIASIAFGLSFPALDGNVYRFLSRYFGIAASPDSAGGKKEFLHVAQSLMPEKNPGGHNQALMEFGAIQCIPQSPDCSVCPLVSGCFASTHNKVKDFPVKKIKPKQRARYFYYYFIQSGDTTWLEKRTDNDIWKNLYQFPLLETDTALTLQKISTLKPEFLHDCKVNLKSVSAIHKHILSHQVIYARLIHLEIQNDCRLNNRFTQIDSGDISFYAIPRLIEKLIQKTGFFEF